MSLGVGALYFVLGTLGLVLCTWYLWARCVPVGRHSQYHLAVADGSPYSGILGGSGPIRYREMVLTVSPSIV